jgi:hypothetical protein
MAIAYNEVAEDVETDLVDYDEDATLVVGTLTGRIVDLDSVLAYTEMQGANLESEINKLRNKFGQEFYGALNKFVEDYTLEDGRTPKVIYRLTLSADLDRFRGTHVRFADNINPDTIDIDSDKSNATYLIGRNALCTYPKLETTDQLLDHMRVLSIVGGKSPTISVLEPPRVIPSNNRNNLYKAQTQTPAPPPRAR